VKPKQTPERVLEILRTRLSPVETRGAYLLGDRQNTDHFVGQVGSDLFTVRRARFPGSGTTPILRASVARSSTGASLDMGLVVHTWTRVGLIAQIVLMLVLTTLGVLAGLRNPVFFVGALFVVGVQLAITLPAYLARRRDWCVLSDFVCGAVGGSRT
jgi:hypothetical protein